jgi:hypothetical protein
VGPSLATFDSLIYTFLSDRLAGSIDENRRILEAAWGLAPANDAYAAASGAASPQPPGH